jgi:uncharacterized RDD family membrane protein YckC
MIFRRLAALMYDGLLVLALLLIWTALLLLCTKGEPIPATGWYRLSLICVVASYFIGFWHHGGQTSGMKAWKLVLVEKAYSESSFTHTHNGISYRKALLRFFLAIPSWLLLGVGFLWLLFDKNKQTLYDRLSGTRLLH